MSNNEQTKHQHHDTIKLTLEDDSVMECKVLTVFDCNGKEYLALVPEHPETEGDVFLYGFREHRENEIELINIEVEARKGGFFVWDFLLVGGRD
jgi:hypothetical protein